MSCIIFARFAHIQHDSVLVINELQRGRRIHLFDTTESVAKQRPQQHDAAKHGDGDGKDITGDELHGYTPVLFGGRILAEPKSARDLSQPNSATADVRRYYQGMTKWLAPKAAWPVPADRPAPGKMLAGKPPWHSG